MPGSTIKQYLVSDGIGLSIKFPLDDSRKISLHALDDSRKISLHEKDDSRKISLHEKDEGLSCIIPYLGELEEKIPELKKPENTKVSKAYKVAKQFITNKYNICLYEDLQTATQYYCKYKGLKLIRYGFELIPPTSEETAIKQIVESKLSKELIWQFDYFRRYYKFLKINTLQCFYSKYTTQPYLYDVNDTYKNNCLILKLVVDNDIENYNFDNKKFVPILNKMLIKSYSISIVIKYSIGYGIIEDIKRIPYGSSKVYDLINEHIDKFKKCLLESISKYIFIMINSKNSHNIKNIVEFKIKFSKFEEEITFLDKKIVFSSPAQKYFLLFRNLPLLPQTDNILRLLHYYKETASVLYNYNYRKYYVFSTVESNLYKLGCFLHKDYWKDVAFCKYSEKNSILSIITHNMGLTAKEKELIDIFSSNSETIPYGLLSNIIFEAACTIISEYENTYRNIVINVFSEKTGRLFNSYELYLPFIIIDIEKIKEEVIDENLEKFRNICKLYLLSIIHHNHNEVDTSYFITINHKGRKIYPLSIPKTYDMEIENDKEKNRKRKFDAGCEDINSQIKKLNKFSDENKTISTIIL